MSAKPGKPGDFAPREVFARRIADLLPRELKRRARVQVGEVVFDIARTPDRRPVSRTPRGELLQRIEQAAAELAELHTELQRDHPRQARDVSARDKARRELALDRLPPEMAWADAGLDAEALGHVLAAVREHAAAVGRRFPSEAGAPKRPHGRVIRDALLDAYAASGLPPPSRESFAIELQLLLGEAGRNEKVESLLNELPEFARPVKP